MSLDYLNDDVYLICPTCETCLDIACYPKCLLCSCLKQCINCVKNENIVSVDYVVLIVCQECLQLFEPADLNHIDTHIKIKKEKLARKLLDLKKRV